MSDDVPRFFRPCVIYRRFGIHEAMDGILLGWVPTPILDGTVHGQYCVLMMWLCSCPMRVPMERAA